MGSKWEMYVKYAVTLIILKLSSGKIDSSLTAHFLFKNSRLKAAVKRQHRRGQDLICSEI
jgi:hypothetical protein